MNSKEIMIGNWVNGNHIGFSKDVVIYDFDREHIQHTNDKTPILPIEQFIPIPLTEDWLKRLGFIEEHDLFPGKLCKGWDYMGAYSYLVYVKPWMVLNVVQYGAVLQGINLQKIEFVHQLQNLFYSLVGEELTSTPTPNF